MHRPLTLHRAPLCPPRAAIVPVDKAVIQDILPQGGELETEDGGRPSLSLSLYRSLSPALSLALSLSRSLFPPSVYLSVAGQ